jgi:hypothetical protein
MRTLTGLSIYSFFACILFTLLSSCGKKSPLERALESAENNRVELEKVLDHYAHDSLKYKAACFLIENMAYYHYYSGEELEHKKQFFEILARRNRSSNTITDSLDREMASMNLGETVVKRDIREVGFEYLVNNIEWAFKVWEEQPWGKNVSFEDFCEYILPYRINDEDLTYWREDIYNKYNQLLNDIRHLPEAEDPLFVSQVLFDSLRRTPVHFSSYHYYDYHVGPKIAEWRSGNCQQQADAAIYIYRALGLPCGFDMMPMRGDGNVSHLWNFIIDKDKNSHFFSLSYSSGQITKIKEYPHPKGKVYRSTFSLNPELLDSKKEKNTIYPFFRYPRFKDVTHQYTPIEQTLNFPLSYLYNKLSSGDVVYLCQATRLKWIPVAASRYKNKQLIFDNIEGNIVFTLALYKDNTIIPISDPFYLDEESNIHVFSAQKEMVKATLYHKYKLDFGFRQKLEGGVFEGSNVRDFSKKDTLFTITERPNRLYSTVTLNSDKEYRYVRYIGPDGGYCNIAEVAFYESADQQAFPLTGKIIGTPNNDKKKRTHNYTNVFDGDPNTSFDYYLPNGGWAGLDLERKTNIKKITYTPRNRDNFIRVGNTYELFYNQNLEWLSAGTLTADSDSIIYEVPRGSLLYLKNHTQGIDERIFEYSDDRQKFW